MRKRIVVIGAGIGGTGCGALLAKAGHDVTVLESHPFEGGRCAAFERDGFSFDFGVHMFSRGEKGPLGVLNREVGGDLKWITKDPACRVMGKMTFDFPLDIRSLFRQLTLAFNLNVGLNNYIGAFRLFTNLMKGRDIDANDPVALDEYVAWFTDDESIHLFINCVSQLYFALSSSEASAGEFIWCFSKMFNNAAFGYPRGGARKIPLTFIDGLSRSGGSVRFEETVGRIIVETERDRYPADVVISNAGLNRTITLAGAENFPAAYVDTARGYRYSNPYVTVKYALDRPVIPYPVVFYMPDVASKHLFDYIGEGSVPEDPYLFMPVPSNLDPSLAPVGKQLVIAGTPVSSGASNEICQQVLDRVHRRVCLLFPELDKHILWQERGTRSDTSRITGHPEGGAIGLGQFPGQVGRRRPALESPVEGLWLVGADAGSRGIGTELAAGSAIHLAKTLIKKWR